MLADVRVGAREGWRADSVFLNTEGEKKEWGHKPRQEEDRACRVRARCKTQCETFAKNMVDRDQARPARQHIRRTPPGRSAQL